MRLPRHNLQGGKNLVGPNLRVLRLRCQPSVTLEDLAGRLAARGLYIDRTSLGRIERRERSVFDFELVAIAAALRIQLQELFAAPGKR